MRWGIIVAGGPKTESAKFEAACSTWNMMPVLRNAATSRFARARDRRARSRRKPPPAPSESASVSVAQARTEPAAQKGIRVSQPVREAPTARVVATLESLPADFLDPILEHRDVPEPERPRDVSQECARFGLGSTRVTLEVRHVAIARGSPGSRPRPDIDNPFPMNN